MKDILSFFDEYTLKARFLPACIAALPLMSIIASYFDWNEFLVANIVVGGVSWFDCNLSFFAFC